MGRPKPEEIKKLEGTSRADRRRNSPKPAPAKTTPPDGLDDDALAFWNEVAPQLSHLNVLTKNDLLALRAAAKCYSRWIRAENACSTNGLVFQVNGGPRRRPETTIAAEALRELRLWLIEFGMTPAARTRVEVAPNAIPAPKDEMSTGKNVVPFEFGFKN